MNILARSSYVRSVKKFSSSEITEINAAIALLVQTKGKPHVHSGLSIRKLRRSIFEIRAGLETRVFFARESGGHRTPLCEQPRSSPGLVEGEPLRKFLRNWLS